MMENPFKMLRVIDRLEVGPVRLEPNRLRTMYRVTTNGRTDSFELIYRYEEDAFDVDDPVSLNLAGMISIQAALNYGLFCEEILFHDPFDRHDRRFIEDMTANTAREIFVKKFLEPNPYLIKTWKMPPPVRRENYCQAGIRFRDQGGPTDRNGDAAGKDDRAWEVDNSRYSVLSSGGKDSLLSFGLLNEIGYEVHPVFINESGRHWFTALNAYRSFSRDLPNTARVWTNSDRLFNWMLGHFPFIRKDFRKIQSDEYPIRLWTVAVFLFGALPLLRKRGIGRLVVGNEYDTTRRPRHQGIPHFDGLYDQSRYFDNALTRYYHRKRWGVSQFSILRVLSELLIEKILVERYPDLQKSQVSCHAAHKESMRVRPCGRCEKCRRIVGMLMALGADPGHCGYSRKQVEDCLRSVITKEINQDKEGIEHLAYMLNRKGLISEPAIGPIKGRKRPQIMNLRFDPERSPVEGIPVELREPLYRIYLDHVEGALKRSGRTWLEFDPWTDPVLNRPFPFDNPATATAAAYRRDTGKETIKTDFLLGEMTWPEARGRFKEVDIALLPVGAVEQHGPHLPLDCDAFDAEYTARKVAEKCGRPRPLVLPLVPYGVSYHHEDFSGTISISPESLSSLVYDIGMSAVQHGITKLVIINGHGGNGPALHFAAQMINRDAHIFTCVDTGETSDPDIDVLVETPNDVHAGEIETSTSLATRPHLVDTDKGKKFVPRFSSRYLNFTSKRSVGWYAHTSKISPTGVLGDPTKGTIKKGKLIWDVMIKNLVEFVEDLKKLSLDEIFQKRY